MQSSSQNELKRCYRVVIDTLVTEGRVFQRGDFLTPEDAPGEIESMLHAGVIETADDPEFARSRGDLL